MFDRLRAAGFDIAIRNHAGAILSVDFPDVAAELEDALLGLSIPAAELIGSGGGEAPSTQRLRRRLAEAGWPKHAFDFRLVVDGRATVAQSHEIDHVRRAEAGTLALEIEWNNKDPFFDRDLENFQRLHAQSAISVGILVTRGAALQERMFDLVRGVIDTHGFADEAEMVEAFGMKDRTRRQREAVERFRAQGFTFSEAFAKQFVLDKFSARKVEENELRSYCKRNQAGCRFHC